MHPNVPRTAGHRITIVYNKQWLAAGIWRSGEIIFMHSGRCKVECFAFATSDMPGYKKKVMLIRICSVWGRYSIIDFHSGVSCMGLDDLSEAGIKVWNGIVGSFFFPLSSLLLLKLRRYFFYSRPNESFLGLAGFRLMTVHRYICFISVSMWHCCLQFKC